MNKTLHVDALRYIFGHCINMDMMLTCHLWWDISSELITKNPRIVADQNPMLLPADLCWPMLTVPQKAALPQFARDQYGDHARLWPAYEVIWQDIMTYCRENNDVDWLLRGQWQEFPNTLENIFAILFLEHEQFRVCLSRQMKLVGVDSPIDIDTYTLYDLAKVMGTIHDLICALDGLYQALVSVTRDITFIDAENKILPNVWGDEGPRCGILSAGDSHNNKASICEYLMRQSMMNDQSDQILDD